MSPKQPKLPWYKDGVKFQCQGSGKCCISRGEYGFVYVTAEDRRRMAKEFGVPTRSFTSKYCKKTDEGYHLIEEPGRSECLFLENNQCSVYKARPTQCRTWPFWPEFLNAKKWRSEVKNFCPGVGKGKLYDPVEIETIMRSQEASDNSKK